LLKFGNYALGMPACIHLMLGDPAVVPIRELVLQSQTKSKTKTVAKTYSQTLSQTFTQTYVIKKKLPVRKQRLAKSFVLPLC